MFEAEAEVQRKFCGWKDIAETQTRGGTGGFLVYIRAVAGEDGVTGSVVFLDIRIADGVASEWFYIPACAVVVEKMAIAYEEGDEDEMGLAGGEIFEAGFQTDLIAVGQGKTAVDEPTETGGRLAFHDELGRFDLCVEGSREKDREC